ncbi:tumor susceptibility gene 101 protein [Daktulosphaira vitifoliae]|uniref:tumor susceptibility gene 101 protein n=1 Tax=Daktulosphaira vitifoliae TaxID=58002 RepID=UPI0021AAD30A|nr:tumor susceptibility gene 101 protein [Daktulosphaira vitifoliae]
MIRIEESRLKSYLTMYKFPEQTKKEIIKALNSYHGLICNYETFLFSNRIEKKLINLSGTIPVIFKGTTYHIPICIWLMDTHPNNAPICYVKPTVDMRIKMSMYVDHNGKIYLPYLHNWTPTTSNLLELIGIMTVTFSETPPVYSVTRTDPAVNPVPYPTQMPYSGNNSNVMLPYPPISSQPTSATSNIPTTYHSNTTTPYPLYNSQFPTPSYPTSSANTASFAPYTPPYPIQNSSHNIPYPQQNTSVKPEYPPYPTSGNLPNTATGLSDGGTITEEHIKASLLSAIEDKVRRRFNEQMAQNKAELDILLQSQRELTLGKNKLDSILTSLNKEKIELEQNIQVLRDKEIELEIAISKLSVEDNIDIDDAVTTTAPLYKQILNAFAEEAATEDAIYYMGEALRRGVIDLEVFLKQVRTLSRKQFMLRALMQRCRHKAGLVA